MKLIGSHTSPFVRKVRIVLAEKKIDYEFVIDSPWLAETRVADLNPLGKIPVLLLDDETPLFDSRVIVEYLDNMAPNNKLLPATNRERTEVKRWESVGDGICDAAASAFLEAKRPKKEQSASWISRQNDKVTRSLEYLSEQLGDKTVCCGLHFSLADVATVSALGYLAFRFPEIRWEENHPNLAKLYQKMMQRPAFADTVPFDS